MLEADKSLQRNLLDNSFQIAAPPSPTPSLPYIPRHTTPAPPRLPGRPRQSPQITEPASSIYSEQMGLDGVGATFSLSPGEDSEGEGTGNSSEEEEEAEVVGRGEVDDGPEDNEERLFWEQVRFMTQQSGL